eukprot:CAMPEP_0170111768 /NCGR_PEP_ID=MMETSP0020_2-20130122/8687_1 /TAXON_ID=98059 /ORGANISM="Dinobryon sp., Strain UTEXLB2267" /LENGTH=72 /DNA_ID=CAMNT_0010337391 /DNA_START=218 /DNA_END=436 /DNA_ORIENTATION=-
MRAGPEGRVIHSEGLSEEGPAEEGPQLPDGPAAVRAPPGGAASTRDLSLQQKYIRGLHWKRNGWVGPVLVSE